ncbi:MAG TPA: hypothetical protein PKV83_07370, partial [Methanothrix sp.]|nr:hypothetical protein [Methanothrix sp.]
SVISFNLIYPSPVMVSLSSSFNVEPFRILERSVPISLMLFALAYAFMQRLPAGEVKPAERIGPLAGRARAWVPLILPMLLILLGTLREEAKLPGDPNVALLLGALICLALAKDKLQDVIHVASRRSGVVLLDLCGAGAFGYVVAQSGLGKEIYSLAQFLPLLVMPFLVAALLQLAQGSRVVTVVIAAQILADYPLDGLTMILLVSSGAFMLTYISDPYFWLIKNSTGASMEEVVLGYSLPLSLMGLMAFGLAAISSYL